MLRAGSTLLVRNLNVYAKQRRHVDLAAGLSSVGAGHHRLLRRLPQPFAAAMPGGWNVDANGAWSQEANWLLMCHGSATSAAFGNKITAPRILTVDVPVILGSMFSTPAKP